ncbi:hypothetical protein PM082_010973 [Marasmius tenuissimus]|nr:hypothetical protein PM082_010973 [Marasmius tenuissimus]
MTWCLRRKFWGQSPANAAGEWAAGRKRGIFRLDKTNFSSTPATFSCLLDTEAFNRSCIASQSDGRARMSMFSSFDSTESTLNIVITLYLSKEWIIPISATATWTWAVP